MTTENRNTPVPAAEADREAFEAAYAEFCDISLSAVQSWRSDAFGVEAYKSSHAHAAWIGWKLCLATPFPKSRRTGASEGLTR